MKLPKEWPKVVQAGSATAKIYRASNRKGDELYEEFKVTYYDQPGHRIVKTFSDYEAAWKHANNATANFTRGDIQALTLTNEDRLIYLRAKKTLTELGVPLDVAAAEYAAAKRLLRGQTLLEAAEFCAKSCHDLIPAKVKQVVDELIGTRRNPPNKRRPASKYYLQDLESRLGKFAESFQCPIQSVGSNEVRLFLNALKGGGRTHHNYARLLKTLFRYAQQNRYYPKNIDPFEGVNLKYDDDGEIAIFTPVELRAFIEVAKPDVLPFLVIGAFAGLRHAELCRLDWADVKSEYIEVKKGKAKTRSRRLVPIAPNLAKWLAGIRRDSSPVVPYANMGNQLVKLVKAANKDLKTMKTNNAPKKLEWKFNGLRHSFISYRLAIVKNENQVAMESGNSPAMIHAHYRELVTDKQAEEWFSIVPEQRSAQALPESPNPSPVGRRNVNPAPKTSWRNSC